MALSSNSYAIQVRGLKMILAQKSALKVPEWPSCGNFCKVTETRIFWKSAKGDQEKFLKNCPKS